MANVEFTNLVRQYGRTTALKSVSGVFGDGLVTCMLGPSGCGKTTLLRMIAGLEQPTAGQIFFDRDEVAEWSSSRRNVGMVFQSPVVYPGLTVFDNVALPLRGTLPGPELRKRVGDVLELVELQAVAQRKVDTLGNAERQKVSVARAVARRPRVLLFDEPVTNIAAGERITLKRAFKRLTTEVHLTLVYVTHDQTEAMTLADHIAVMQDGRLVQYGPPRAVYRAPRDRFVGWFLGNPGMNFVQTRAGIEDGAALFAGVQGAADLALVGFRPEYVAVSPVPEPGYVPARVVRAPITVGGQRLLTLQAGETTFKAKTHYRQAYTAGQTVYVNLPADQLRWFDPAGAALLRGTPGRRGTGPDGE